LHGKRINSRWQPSHVQNGERGKGVKWTTTTTTRWCGEDLFFMNKLSHKIHTHPHTHTHTHTHTHPTQDEVTRWQIVVAFTLSLPLPLSHTHTHTHTHTFFIHIFLSWKDFSFSDNPLMVCMAGRPEINY